MSAAERIATAMAASPGGAGTFNILLGVQDAKVDNVIIGLVLVVFALVIYFVISKEQL